MAREARGPLVATFAGGDALCAPRAITRLREPIRSVEVKVEGNLGGWRTVQGARAGMGREFSGGHVPARGRVPAAQQRERAAWVDAAAAGVSRTESTERAQPARNENA